MILFNNGYSSQKVCTAGVHRKYRSMALCITVTDSTRVAFTAGSAVDQCTQCAIWQCTQQVVQYHSMHSGQYSTAVCTAGSTVQWYTQQVVQYGSAFSGQCRMVVCLVGSAVRQCAKQYCTRLVSIAVVSSHCAQQVQCLHSLQRVF